MSVLRGLLIAVAMSGVSIASSIPVVLLPQPAAAQGVETIVVEGNRRVEAETVARISGPAPAVASINPPSMTDSRR